MRLTSLAARLSRSRRLMFGIGAGAAVLVLIVVAVLLSRGGDDASTPPASSSTTEPRLEVTTPPATPSALPDDCRLVATIDVGTDSIVRAGVAQTIKIVASACVMQQWGDVEASALTMTIDWSLQPPDGPRSFRTELAADVSHGLAWRGTVIFPAAGDWSEIAVVAGAVDRAGFRQSVASNIALDTSRAGLPLDPLQRQLTVLHLDRPDEPARWDARPGGLAWLPGATPGSAARAVWVQGRGAEEWVVAGDPATGTVTPLFTVSGQTEMFGAPDGRSLVVVDRPQTRIRIRLYDGERAALIDVPSTATYTVSVAWAPDSSAVLIVDDQIRLVGSDGRKRLVAPFSSQNGDVAWWSPDSRWALVRGSAKTGSGIEHVLDVAQAGLRPFPQHRPDASSLGGAVFSADGKALAYARTDLAQKHLEIVASPTEELSMPALDLDVLVSIPIPDGALNPAIGNVAWSPDGRFIAFEVVPDQRSAVEGTYIGASVRLLEVSSRTVRELVAPEDACLMGSAFRWSPDGAALFRSCNNGGALERPIVEVIDVAAGKVARRIEAATWIGSIDGVRQLITAGGSLLSVRSLEAPRVLLADPAGQPYSYLVSPSPDGNRLSVLASAERAASEIIGVQPDGSGQRTLGVVVDGAVEGIASLDRGQQLASGEAPWRALTDGRGVLPLPPTTGGSSRLESAFSADGAYAAYWLTGKERQPRQLVLFDARRNVTRRLEVFEDEPALIFSMAITSDGQRIAYVAGHLLVVVEVSSGQTRRINLEAGIPALQRKGIPGPIAWVEVGRIEVLTEGDGLWDVDLATGSITVASGSAPSPGGWTGAGAISASPDGRSVAVVTRFGAFVRSEGGAWLQVVAGSGGIKGGSGRTVVWSPDSRSIALSGDPAFGIVVAAADGGRAYELVRAVHNVDLRVLSWTAEGGIAYVANAY